MLYSFRYATSYTAVATIVARKFATKGSVGHVPVVDCAHAHVVKLPIHFPAPKIYLVVGTHVGKN